TIAVVVQNALETAIPFEFADPADASRGIKATLAPRSFNTFVIDKGELNSKLEGKPIPNPLLGLDSTRTGHHHHHH
ncbi:hypothetical protein PXI12_09550, partial [Bifidobacterium longum]|nr:hypothetical protein [Bifidobacterium longum]